MWHQFIKGVEGLIGLNGFEQRFIRSARDSRRLLRWAEKHKNWWRGGGSYCFCSPTLTRALVHDLVQILYSCFRFFGSNARLSPWISSPSFHLKLCEGLTLNDQHQEASDCSNFGSTEYVLVQLQESAQLNWCSTIVSVDLWWRVWWVGYRCRTRTKWQKVYLCIYVPVSPKVKLCFHFSSLSILPMSIFNLKLLI